MTDTPHELHGEFPEHARKMDALRKSDAHFAKLFDDYDKINEKVYKAETFEKPTGHFREEEMKKRRAFLKDEIFRILSSD